MQKLVVVSVLALFACKKEAPPKNEFEAFERKFVRENELLAQAMRARGEKVDDKDVLTSYRAVFIGPSGVFVDRKLVATLAEIDSKHTELDAAIDANAKLLPTVGWRGLAVTFNLEDEPAANAMSALHLFADRETYFNVVREDPEVPQMASHILCSQMKLRDKPANDASAVPQLSVLLDPKVIWVGVSKLNEFQEIPDTGDERDFAKLEMTLREHKASELFGERTDVELGAAAGTSSQVLHALGALCDAGFVDIALLPRDQLSAVPQL
ncbi:MAG: hypothetical protein HOV81_28910 [Kofleriaceae bacterium]|nr:hypothetical protein [Kofleriaceae bacterium]